MSSYVDFCVRRRVILVAYLTSLIIGCGTSKSTSELGPKNGVLEDSDGSSKLLPAVWSDDSSDALEWTRMSGPQGDHRHPAKGLNWDWPAGGPLKAWSVECGSGYGMPIVAGGHVIVLAKEADQTTITARSLDDGSVVWRWDAAPASYTDDYEDYSDGPYSTPTVQWGRVFAITGDGLLVALDLKSGDELGRVDLLQAYNAPVGAFPWGTSPFGFELDGTKRLLINVGGPGAGVVCLDAETLTEVWKATDEGRSYGTPRVFQRGDRWLAALLTAKNAILVDATDGSPVWSKTFGVRGDPKLRANSVSPMVVGHDPTMLFFTAGPGAGLLRVEVKSLDSISDEMFGSLGRRTLDSQFNNLTHDGQRLYGFTSKWNRQANLRCIRLNDGELLWEYDSELQRGGSIAVDGKLLVLGEEGHLAVLRLSAEGPDVLFQSAQSLVEGPCYTAPVLADSRLLVRTEREVVCFDLRAVSVDAADTAIQSR